MAAKIKQKIAKNFYNAANNIMEVSCHSDLIGCFTLIKEVDKIMYRIVLPLKKNANPTSSLFKDSQSELIEHNTIKNLNYLELVEKTPVEIELNVKHLIKDVLDSNPTALNFKSSPKKFLIEFSSPNIAKPFHVGHLRSTIIGNVLSNLKKKLGNDVVRMNYLGDWGTQIGLIQTGVELEKLTDEDLKQDSMHRLFRAYVKGNREAEKNREVFERALKIFQQLETGNEELLNKWSKYRNWTIEELNGLYKRLGVTFDEYSWESNYKRKDADKVLKMLEDKGILSVDEKGRTVAVLGEKQIPLIKSDNTSLYLMRDLMAVIDRQSKHKFDKMYYIVENGQNEHFGHLLKLCRELGIGDENNLKHVKFGRIQGMSTRQGKIIFLKDVLEEAKERTYEKQVASKTTKVELNSKEIADILGVSAVIVNDLKYSRKKDYNFSWDNIVQLSSSTGINLQYCHCRLHSLVKNSGVTVVSECDPDALLEPSAVNLIVDIAKYEEILLKSDSLLEPCTLVSYLFKLVNSINTAFKYLPVKNADSHVGSQRLLMFNKSREVLGEGLRLLGLKPLDEM